jgi:hypothetical protein
MEPSNGPANPLSEAYRTGEGTEGAVGQTIVFRRLPPLAKFSRNFLA